MEKSRTEDGRDGGMKKNVALFGVGLATLTLFFSQANLSSSSELCSFVRWEDGKEITIPATHIVAGKDTLGAIARRYGDNLEELKERNGLESDIISPGDTILIVIKPTTAVASWYGDYFHGRIMASGEPFDMHDPEIVAHKTLPLGTEVILKNPENGRMVHAIVKDRGPYVRGRDLDLSYAAAEKLEFKERGVIRLEYLIVCLPQHGDEGDPS